MELVYGKAMRMRMLLRSATLLLCLHGFSQSWRAQAAEVDDLISSLGWHEPATLSGQEEVVNIPENVAVKTCSTLKHKITVLDLGTWALQQDLHPCTLHGDHTDTVKLPHSGQLHLAEAIKSSQYYTADLEKAEIVLVKDFCYYHTGEAFKKETRLAEDGTITVVRGGAMAEAYRALAQSPRFKRSSGANFVFYDSHAGLSGADAMPLDDFLCTEFRNSTLLTTDPALRAGTCTMRSLEPLPRSRIMTVAVVPHRLDASRPDMHLSRPPLLVDKRDLLINMRALCEPVEAGLGEAGVAGAGGSFGLRGKIMRAKLTEAFKEQGQEVDCSLYEVPAAGQPKGSLAALDFGATYAAMERSMFCLVLPGQTGAQYRLSEALLAGCIPVFIGAPFPAVPFLDELRYSTAAIFVNVTNPAAWQLNPDLEAAWGTLVEEVKSSNFDVARDWMSNSAAVYNQLTPDRTISVGSVSEILPLLGNMEEEEASKKLAIIASIRSNFGFDVELTAKPNAVNTMLSGICRRAARGCSRSFSRKEGVHGGMRCRRLEVI